MKACIILLCILPLALGVPQQRFILDSLQSLGVSTDLLVKDLQTMLDVIGSDPTEALCESECHNVFHNSALLDQACPLICHSFQALIRHYQLTADTTTASATTPTSG